MTKGRLTKVPQWVAYLVAFLALGCQEPTQITLEVNTDAACEEVQDTSIAAGRPSAVEKQQPATVTDACSAGSGRIGSLVLVPKDDDEATVGVRVVTGIGKSAAKCQDDGYVRVQGEPEGTGCIVARREVSYVASTPLRLPVEMSLDCLNIPCEANRTCFRGSCVSPAAACSGGRCGLDAVIRDAGGPDADASEGGGRKPDASEESGVREGGGGDGEAGLRDGGDGDADDGEADVSVPVCAPVGARIATWNVAGRTPSPVLDPCVLRYSVSVGLLESEVGITIGTDDPLASIRVNGRPMLSGGTSEAIPVGADANDVAVQVTSVLGETATYVLEVSRAETVTQVRRFDPSFPLEREVGKAVAISGNTIAISADALVAGVDGGAPSEDAIEGGRVYVYVRGAQGWAREAVLRGQNTENGDEFGASIGLEGDVLVVGAPGERSAGIAAGPADNSKPREGAAYVFRRRGATWSQEAYLKASGDSGTYRTFGSAVALGGDTLVVGAPREGAAYVFSGPAWTETDVLRPPYALGGADFGASLALAAGILAVGSPGDSSAAQGIGGDERDNRALNAGAVHVYAKSGARWGREAYVKASTTRVGARADFGHSVAVSDGTLVVGAPMELGLLRLVDGGAESFVDAPFGAAFVFSRNEGVWAQEAMLKAAEHATLYFAWAVALEGRSLAVGASIAQPGPELVIPGATSSNELKSGGAYVFVRDDGLWLQSGFLKADFPEAFDSFGARLAFSRDGVLAVSAPGGTTFPFAAFARHPPGPGAVYIYE